MSAPAQAAWMAAVPRMSANFAAVSQVRNIEVVMHTRQDPKELEGTKEEISGT